MALLRIVSCDYNVLVDSFVLSVDALYSEDDTKDRNFLVTAPRKDVLTLPDLKVYVEEEIASQRTTVPNWTGVTWKSTRI